jgi:hypothetical protein
MIPFAVIRVLGAVRSVTAFIAAPGKIPSVTPNNTRMTSSMPNEVANPVSPVNADQATIATNIVSFGPILSAISPPGNWNRA